jgi:hypothetical protein
LQLLLSTRAFIASHLANTDDASRLRLAIGLAPDNAEYQYRMGKHFAFVENDSDGALQFYESAVDLNPHNARYWLDLAAAYQVKGDTAAQRQALENAVHANPTNPDVAWEAGNFFLVQGENDPAFRQFRVVLQNQPNMALLALRLCWRVSPDVDTLLSGVVPPSTEPNIAFLQLLMSQKDPQGAAKVWRRLIDLHQPFDTRYLFQYIKFLVVERQVDQARIAWQQAASLLRLNAYLPSNNLIVNGQFSEDVLNGGFDWNYQVRPGVSLTLDPTQFHSGHRSLSIAFDGAGINDAGFYQAVPIEPSKDYEFSAFYKADGLQGAGGPVLAVRDFYSGQSYFASEELKDSDVWKPVDGTFTTGPETRLLVVRVERVPPGNVIRGRLWVDDFDLALK